MESEKYHDLNEIRIEIKDDQHEGIHTIQLQSPGGSSHFVKGLVVSNTQRTHSGTMEELTGSEMLHMGDGDSSQILQMVRLGTDENGETIIFVQPEDKGHEEMLSYQEISGSSSQAVDPSNKIDEEMSIDEMSSDEDDNARRRCVVCLKRRRFTQDIFDSSSNQLLYNVNVLISHLNIEIKGTPANTGLCPSCLNHLRRWHSFNSSVAKRHEQARVNELNKVVEEEEEKLNILYPDEALPINEVVLENFTPEEEEEEEEPSKASTRKRKRAPAKSISRKEKYNQRMKQIKEILHNSSYQHLIKRDLNEESLEYMAERLLTTKSNSSAKMKEIENMTFSQDKLRSVFCTECGQSISGGKQKYFRHMKETHKEKQEDLPLPCDICGQFFPEKDLTGVRGNYFPHWISHFYFEACMNGDCKEKFPNTNLLKKHSIFHGERTKYPCPQCDKVLAKKASLEIHLRTHLPEEEKKKNGLVCPICSKTITAPTLKAHMYSVHSDERPWKCEMCDIRFKHKSDLNGHRNAVHLGIKNFICKICGKSFGHQCGLRIHTMSHENKRNHSCTTCGKKFLTMWHLKKHSVTHKETKDILCPTCSKGFKNNESLQEHMTIHTGEMPFECHICGRKVRILTNLYKHFIVHKKNKTYYSKKDGLPDPLDTYIVEQQKKKFSNTILQTVIEKRKETSTVEITLEQEEVVEDPLEPVLTVNRSKRVTYRAPPKFLADKTTSSPVPSTSTQQESFIVTEIDGNYSLSLADGTSSQIVYSVIEADKSNVAN